jgi:hypothetical protein
MQALARGFRIDSVMSESFSDCFMIHVLSCTNHWYIGRVSFGDNLSLAYHHSLGQETELPGENPTTFEWALNDSFYIIISVMNHERCLFWRLHQSRGVGSLINLREPYSTRLYGWAERKKFENGILRELFTSFVR